MFEVRVNEKPVLCFQLYDSIPLVRYLPLPFKNAFKNVEVGHIPSRTWFQFESSTWKKVTRANFTAFQTAEDLVKDVFAEHKKTRMSGDPRDFVDCYYDELDKVCN